MEIDLNNYRIVKIYDNYDWEITGALLLNNKHNVEDFRKAIHKAKEKHEEDIYNYGFDWEYIEEELDNFDYYKFDFGESYIDY